MEDVVVMAGDSCPCGRSQPLIASIEGRAADFLIATNGDLVSGISLTDHFMLGITGLAQIQIVQDERDHLVLNVVKGADHTPETEIAIKSSVQHFLGNDMRFDVVYMDEIPQEDTGKYRFSICLVDNALLSK
jgi:phenylacetate-CoA ligase